MDQHKDGRLVTLIEDAWLIQDPDNALRIIGKLKSGKEVFVYKQVNDLYAVATPENGHAGYVPGYALGITPADPSLTYLVPETPQKSIARARLLSIALPGAGYVYTEEYGKGVTVMLLSLGGLIGGQAISKATAEFSCVDFSNPDSCSLDTDYSAARIGAAIYIGFVALGAWRSGAAVRRYRANNNSTPRFTPVIGANNVGVALTLSLGNSTK